VASFIDQFKGTLGLAQAATIKLSSHARRNAFIIVVIAVVLVIVPLAATSTQVISETIAETQATEAASTWLEGSTYALHSVDAHGDEVTVIVGGTGEPPSTADLLAIFKEKSSQKLYLNLELVPIQEQRLEVVPADE